MRRWHSFYCLYACVNNPFCKTVLSLWCHVMSGSNVQGSLCHCQSSVLGLWACLSKKLLWYSTLFLLGRLGSLMWWYYIYGEAAAVLLREAPFTTVCIDLTGEPIWFCVPLSLYFLLHKTQTRLLVFEIRGDSCTHLSVMEIHQRGFEENLNVSGLYIHLMYLSLSAKRPEKNLIQWILYPDISDSPILKECPFKITWPGAIFIKLDII